MYLGCLIIAWGPREWTGPWGRWLLQRETRDWGPGGSILRKAWIISQVGWGGRSWRSLTPAEIEKGNKYLKIRKTGMRWEKKYNTT